MNKSQVADTIIQLATPFAVSAIHIIRISGKEALPFLRNATGLKKVEPRRVYYRPFAHKNKTLDQVLCFYFKSPHSYSGEDMVEIHTHGSLHVVDSVLKAGVASGLRLAEPGEFTRRAFFSGKMTLEQSEAVDALIRSRSDFFRDNALRILENKASLRFADIKTEILDILSDLESAIEFPEDRIGDDFVEKKKLYSRYESKLKKLLIHFERLTSNYDKGKKLDTGIRVALTGRPNAGKSTLMNALLREDRVLVSEIQGTTRDYVKEEIRVDGHPVFLYDTAGIRETDGELEKKGIEKTRLLLKEVDIAVVLLYGRDCFEAFKDLLSRPSGSGPRLLAYLSKSDLLSKIELEKLTAEANKIGFQIVSALNLLEKKSAEKVESDLSKLIQENFFVDTRETALLNERQHWVSVRILERLGKILSLLGKHENEEIIIEEFQELQGHLDELNLSFENEEVFDDLFKKFCIGK